MIVQAAGQMLFFINCNAKGPALLFAGLVRGAAEAIYFSFDPVWSIRLNQSQFVPTNRAKMGFLAL